jgi:Tol biopolymer transport system component
VNIRTLVACLASLAAFAAAGPAHAAFPGGNGTIAFTGSPCSGRDCIMRISPSGGFPATVGLGSHPAWSPDGQRIAFADGTDIYTIKWDGTDRQLVLDWSLDVEAVSWAPSGDRLAAALGVCDLGECRVDIHVIVLGPSGAQSVMNITPDAFPDRNPAWSPDGTRIAFDTSRDSNNDVFTMGVDGSNRERLTTDPAGDGDPNWAPSGNAIAFTSGRDGADAIYTMNADGTAQTRRSVEGRSRQPAWSPNGTRIVFSGIRGEGTSGLYTIPADGGSESKLTGQTSRNDYEPDWQPTAPSDMSGYPRPRSASPLTVSLVPSYVQCLAPNRTHGPPLGFGSCSPPSQESPHITVGTPDANGVAANSAGFARFKAFESAPGGPAEADVIIELSFSDVRCTSGTAGCGPANDRAGADYTGEFQLLPVIRLTEKSRQSDPLLPLEPQTTQDFPFPVRAGCNATSSMATGAACSVLTSANAVVPGSVWDSRRAMWQMDHLRVLDGGADGDADTAGDNRLFATQGVFVP